MNKLGNSVGGLTGRRLTLVERGNLLVDTDRKASEASPGSERLRWITRHYFGGSRRRLRKFLSAFGIPITAADALVDAGLFDDRAAPCVPGNGDGTFDRSVHQDGSLRDAVLSICWPELVRAERAIADCFGRHAHLLADPEMRRRQCVDLIIGRLWTLMGPTLAVAFNLFCTKVGLQATLASTPAFLHAVAAQQYRDQFFSKYAALEAAVRDIAEGGTVSVVEMLDRIAYDRQMLSAALALPSGHPITAIRFSAGDTHKGGRSVCILTLGEHRLVYKPRPLSPEVLFNRFASWLESKDASVRMARIPILDRGAYGYSSFVAYAPATCEADRRNHYRGLGCLLAVSYVLGISDLHFENVIAGADGPAPVDIESILHKPLRRSPGAVKFEDSYGHAFFELLFHSLMLPMKIATPHDLMDPIAIGSAGIAPMVGQHLEFHANHDGAVGFVERIGRGVRDNRIGSADDLHDPDTYVHDIVDGYDAAASCIATHTAELHAAEWIDVMSAVTSRWIPRRTRQYLELMAKMRHPSVLSDALDRDLLVVSLWSDDDRRPIVDEIIRSELRDVQNGDVPYFCTRGDATNLLDAAGNGYPDAFAMTGTAAFLQRLQALSAMRPAHHAAIRASLASTRPELAALGATNGAPSNLKFDRTQALQCAADIADDLIEAVHMVDGVPFWSGLHELTPGTVAATVLSPSLYDGAMGIGLFIATLNRLEPSERRTALARGTLELTERLLADEKQQASGSAFTGITGVLYANMLIADALDVPIARYTPCIDRALARWSRTEANCDVVGGLAGAMAVLLRYGKRTGNRAAIDRATALRALIGKRAQWAGDHCCWQGPVFDKPLGGFAHGSMGIAWALAQSQEICPDPVFDRLIEGAVRHQESLFDPVEKGWRDERNGGVISYWCHGAAGIGLGARDMARLRPSALLSDIAVCASKAVRKAGLLADDCLCHGTLGNAELLTASSDRPELEHAYASAVTKYASTGSWSCIGAGRERAPGLFCGTAGIGYQMLRFADPDKVANVLLLNTQ